MAKRPSLLETLHAVVVHPAARMALGSLSASDMAVLAKHQRQGTLLDGLRPLADQGATPAAIAAMPAELGEILNKIPAASVKTLALQLQALPRSQDRSISCGC